RAIPLGCVFAARNGPATCPSSAAFQLPHFTPSATRDPIPDTPFLTPPVPPALIDANEKQEKQEKQLRPARSKSPSTSITLTPRRKGPNSPPLSALAPWRETAFPCRARASRPDPG